MTSGTDPGDPDIVAAEYVLGTLDHAERSDFASRLRGDAAARTAVARWEARLTGLAGGVSPVVPPQHVWEAIERGMPAASARTRPFEVVEGGRAASPSPVLMASRNRWRAAAVALGGIAAALTAFVVVERGRLLTLPAEQGDSYVAAINRGGDKPALIVRVDLQTHMVSVMPVAAKAPEGRSLELWYIGNDDKTPHPMGLVDKEPASMPMPMPPGTTPSGATFAVSVEPLGGSTTGGPTGPVVYSGVLVKE